MRVTAQLSADDHREFLDLVARLGKIRSRVRVVSIFLFVMLFFLVLAVSGFVWTLASGFYRGAFVDLLDRPDLLIPIIIGVLLIPVALLLLRSFGPLFGKLRSANKPGAMDESFLREGVNIGASRFDISDDGIHERFDLVQSFFAWEAFQGVRETDRNLYLVVDAGTALIVPKREFDDVGSLQAFIAFVTSHIEAAE